MDESPGKMYALATALSILATVAVGLRFYARRIKKVCLSWDDYLIVLALVKSPLGICCPIVDLFYHALERSQLSARESVCLLVSISRYVVSGSILIQGS